MINIQSIVITGANSGIGAALSELYSKKGVFLHLIGRNEERLNKIASKCKEKGAVVNILAADVRDEDKISEWLLEIDKKHPVDLVIANAGVSAGTSEGNESIKQIKQIFGTNLDGVINTIHPLIPSMSQRKKGCISIVSSIAGFRGLPSAPAYSSSKAAVKVYGEALRGLLRKHGIRVSIVIPGYIKTPMTDTNNFPMPFIMSVDKAALKIKKGIERKKSIIAFPFVLYATMWFLGNLPPFVTDFIFSKLPRKSSNNRNNIKAYD